jgi:hypothetical protein
MLLIWCYQQQGNADGNNAQSCRSQRDNTEATSSTNVWVTSLPLGTNWIGGAGDNEIPLSQRPQQRGRGGAMGGARMQRPPTDQMDMDQVSITSGQSVTIAADPDEIQAQMALLALLSLANSSSLKSIEDDDAHSIAHSGLSVLSHVNTSPGKSGFMSVLREHDSTQWMQAKIIHNQDRPQFDQALQNPDMLYAVVSDMVQIYAQILLPTQADGNTGQPLPPPQWQLTHDGQARVTVVGTTEVMSRNNRPASIPHPLEPIEYLCELDDKPSPSEYPKIVRPPRVKEPNMLNVVKQQGEVLTAFHPDLARKLEAGLVHHMSPALAALYRPDDKSISVIVPGVRNHPMAIISTKLFCS